MANQNHIIRIMTIIVILFRLGFPFSMTETGPYFFRQITGSLRYRKLERPPNKTTFYSESDPPITVYVQMKIKSFRYSCLEGTKESDSLKCLAVTVISSWGDSRLAWNTSISTDYVQLTTGDTIWLPDISFIAKKKDTGYFDYVEVYRNGTVRIVMNPDFETPIIDKHLGKATIRMTILSLKDKISDVVLAWDGMKAISVDEGVTFDEHRFSEVTLDDIQFGPCHSDGIARITDVNFIRKNFSCLYVNIVLKNSAMVYFVTIYLPSCVCILLSWAPFWMDSTSTFGRSLLPLATLVYLLNQKIYFVIEYTLYENRNKLSAWIYGCILFNVFALLQVLTVSFLMREGLGIPKFQVLQEVDATAETEDDTKLDDGQNIVSFFKPRISQLSKYPAASINAISKCLFPITFLIFVLIVSQMD